MASVFAILRASKNCFNSWLTFCWSVPLPRAIRANVRATIAHLRAQSDYLRYAEAQGGLRIVGADYDLASGAVDFFETEAHPWNTTS